MTKVYASKYITLVAVVGMWIDSCLLCVDKGKILKGHLNSNESSKFIIWQV